MKRKYGYKKVTDTLDVRPYSPNDYETAKQWWFEHNNGSYENVAILHEGLLPNTGVVITQGGEPICMVWVHLSNSRLAQLSWMVTKPTLGPRSRIAAISHALFHGEKLAYNAGYKFIQMQSDRKGLSKMVHAAGYKPVKQHDIFAKMLEDDDV